MDKEKQLLDAAINNDCGTALELLKHDDINVNAIVTNGFYQGMSALMIAAYAGNYDVVKQLIAKDANVNAIVTDGFNISLTALLLAATSCAWNVVKLLIEKGANVNAIIADGYFKSTSTLMLAAREGKLDVVKLLIENGADVNAVATYGYDKDFSVLMIAANASEWNIAELLSKNGAIIYEVDTIGKTKAIEALQKKNLKLLKFLLTQGVNVNLNNPDWSDTLNKVDINDENGVECAAYVKRMHDKRFLMPLLHYNMFINKRKIIKQPISMFTKDMTIKLSEMLTDADPKKYTSFKF